MSVYLSEELRRQLEEADDHCCAYCQTLQANSGQRMVPPTFRSEKVRKKQF